jgi:predicted AlkP superfamily pyrophosphatase or phosphodiesterase
MGFYRRVVLAALVLSLVSCTHSSLEPSLSDTGPLILISIDGLHPDYLDRVSTPAIDQLIAGGVQAQWMETVFPSFTFPSHYSIVTGLYPSQHGIVANRMRDPETDAIFTLKDSAQVRDSFWWGGEPIWVTAERQGLTAATLFWPGSEAEIAGHRPTHWLEYQHKLAHSARIQQVLAWIDQAQRPDVITLYFSSVDSMGHSHGPSSVQVDAALRDVDAHIGLLLDGLAQRNLLGHAHILLVSDHGMAEVAEERTVFLDDYIDLDRLQSSLLGPVGFFWPDEDEIEDVISILKNAHPKMTIARPQDLPERFHFEGHRRIPPLLALADDGWLISHRDPNRPYADALGAHGYDSELPSMRTVFIARSPLITPNTLIPPMSVLDIYPLMVHLLGIQPAKNEGNLSVFRPVLKN